MSKLHFESSFRALTAENGLGPSPFNWQFRLYRKLCEGWIPQALDIPTGLGKTSVIALWLLARAAGADLPRRLIYVVDRRAVVDQATDYALTIRENLTTLPELQATLGLSRLLPISTLRGQYADNRAWLETPAEPAILIGTVDMIGSRLLFSGYGVSPRMRPMQAGLLATDSLLVLDEAHLSQPFLGMTRSLAGIAGPRALKVLSLSATQATPKRNAVGEESRFVFRLTAEEAAETEVQKRLNARKSLRMETHPGAKPQEFATQAWSLAEAHPGARILIFRESFDDAVAIASSLEKMARKSSARVGLLTGQRRGYEREQLEAWLTKTGFLAGRSATETAFLVATSAGEVGIDLDADHMLCDLVPWDRMVQRLGRVNRRGTALTDTTVIVWDREDAPGGDPERLRRDLTRGLLQPPEGADSLQAGPGALAELARRPEAARASTPAPLYPALTMPLVEAWAMTSLRDHAGRPEVGPWLRGWETDEPPRTRLAWRQHLPILRSGGSSHCDAEQLERYLEVAPLRPSELLETRTDRVLKWMRERGKQLAKLRAHPDHGQPSRTDLAALILAPDCSLSEQISFADWEEGDARYWKRLERLLPGRGLLLRREVAGLDCDRKEKGKPVTGHGFLDAKVDALPPTGDQEEPAFPDVTVRFTDLAKNEEGLKSPEDGQTLRVFVTGINEGGVEQTGFAIQRVKTEPGEDEDARSIAAPQSLEAHTADVVALVSDFAARLGLGAEITDALVLAARHHDIGKGDPIWQQAAGVNKLELMAKTDGKGARWRLLNGYRHEFGSLVALEKDESLPPGTRELILHLVAAHHGNARPLISPANCAEGPPTEMDSVAGRAALRFAELSRSYGPWHLAWLEAILRAADQQASANPGKAASDG